MSSEITIREWLEEIGLEQFVSAFEENLVTVNLLPSLTSDDLRELGVTALGHRKTLLAAIAAISTRSEDDDLVPMAMPAVVVPTAIPAVPSPPPQRPVVENAPLIAELPESGIFPTPDATVIMGSKAKRKGFSPGFLSVSIGLHVILGLLASYWVVQTIQAERKLQFKAGPPNPSPNTRALEHKVSMKKKKNSGGAPAQPKRIAVAGMTASVTLPDMPTMPSMSGQIALGQMSGMGGAGFGQGLGFGNGAGSGMGGGTGMGGFGLTMFGGRAGAGLIGTFYDLKRDNEGKSIDQKHNQNSYTEMLKDFTKGTIWKMPSGVKYYTGKSNLVAKAFFFPAMADSEAGKAFNEPETGPGMWIAHYTGTVEVPVSGKYRFVGWGDNLMAVRFGSKIVLDASDRGYLRDDDNHQPRASVSFPSKAATPSFNGSWMKFTAGSRMKMDVLLGDEGGIYCAGLLLEREGDNPKDGKHNLPELPLFLAGPLSTEEKGLYETYLPDKSIGGPVFKTTTGGTSPLDMLRP